MIRRSDLHRLAVAVEEQCVLLIGTQHELAARLSALEADNRRLGTLTAALARAGLTAGTETAAGSKPAAAKRG